MIYFWVALASALGADIFTKFWVTNHLGAVWCWNFGCLQITHNPALAWGIPLGGLAPLALALVALIVVGSVFWKNRHQWSSLEKIAWGLILGGGLGNTGERLFFHEVTDFINLGNFPVFNLADGAITLGVILWVAANLGKFRGK